MADNNIPDALLDLWMANIALNTRFKNQPPHSTFSETAMRGEISRILEIVTTGPIEDISLALGGLFLSYFNLLMAHNLTLEIFETALQQVIKETNEKTTHDYYLDRWTRQIKAKVPPTIPTHIIK